jgi:hypothetical protein
MSPTLSTPCYSAGIESKRLALPVETRRKARGDKKNREAQKFWVFLFGNACLELEHILPVFPGASSDTVHTYVHSSKPLEGILYTFSSPSNIISTLSEASKEYSTQ